MCVIPNSLEISHIMIKSVVKPGDTVIDATAGNGHDTAFLAELVGDSGKVYAFDIQREAVERTRKRLGERNLGHRVTLINDGHQNMDLYVKDRVRAVMFNLGYLPGGDHSIATRAETTIAALEKAMGLLEVNGLITIVVYYGGDSGFEEKEEVLKFVETIDFRRFTVMKTCFVNQPNCPPILVAIEKLK